MKTEAESMRRRADEAEEQRVSHRIASQAAQAVPTIDVWRAELKRSRDAEERLADEVATLDKQFRETSSLLEQAMVRGTLVDKKRRLAEAQRSIRTLEQRIEGAEEAPLIPAS